MIRSCLVISVLLIHFSSIAQLRFTDVDRKRFDSISLQDVPVSAPGIATAIVRDGAVLYQKCGGYADLPDSTLITPKTRFNIASNGKQFTALAVLTLIDDGKLGLSDDIRKFFPDLYPNLKETISIQSLLNHTSGLRDCYDLWSLEGYTWWKESFSNQQVLELLKRQTDLNFKPNTAYLYSNTNYILLALIVEKIARKRFVAYTADMFKKLNMPNTSFEDNAATIKGPIARSYFDFNTWTTYEWMWNVCGDGNLFSTLEDQIQWEKIVQGKGKTSIKQKLISKSQHTIESSPFNNYGYGLEFGQYKGMSYAFHEGATGAWKATVIRFPAKKVAMITLTNTGKSIPSMQTRQMADVLFRLKAEKDYLETKPAKVGKRVSEEEIAGTYLTESDFSFQFDIRDGKLWLKRMGRNDIELEREADNVFHQKFDPAFKQEFTTNEKGDLEVTAYYTSHSPYKLTKQNADFASVDFKKFAGRYFNQETGTTIEIRHETNKNFDVTIATNNAAKGLLVSSSKLLVNGYSLIFDRTNGEINLFRLNGERIKNIAFVRSD